MPFEKGRSGNPGGRPKENDEIKKLARKHSKAAIARLVEWMESDNAKASVSAANALLDRGLGKPAQELQLSGELELTHEQRLEQRAKRAAQSGEV